MRIVHAGLVVAVLVLATTSASAQFASMAGDRWLDPAETASLAVTLRNLGQPATDVRATLLPTGWYAELVRAETTYPDLGTGDSAECNFPFYRVHVDPLTPAAHKIGFALRWETAESWGTSEPFFLEVGGPFFGLARSGSTHLLVPARSFRSISGP